MSYDRDRLRRAIADALDPFIAVGTLAVGREAVFETVTDAALAVLTFVCGDSEGSYPRGLLGSPVVEHPRCADPRCPLCRGGHTLVCGRLR
jgi:hypothetical protein